MLEIKSDIRLIVEDSMVVRSESGSVYVVIKLLVESIIEIVVWLLFMLIYWVKNVCYFVELLYID